MIPQIVTRANLSNTVLKPWSRALEWQTRVHVFITEGKSRTPFNDDKTNPGLTFVGSIRSLADIYNFALGQNATLKALEKANVKFPWDVLKVIVTMEVRDIMLNDPNIGKDDKRSFEEAAQQKKYRITKTHFGPAMYRQAFLDCGFFSYTLEQDVINTNDAADFSSLDNIFFDNAHIPTNSIWSDSIDNNNNRRSQPTGLGGTNNTNIRASNINVLRGFGGTVSNENRAFDSTDEESKISIWNWDDQNVVGGGPVDMIPTIEINLDEPHNRGGTHVTSENIITHNKQCSCTSEW